MGAHEDRMTRLQEAEFRNDLLRKDVETRVQDAREDQERIAVLEDALGQIVAKGRDGFFASCPAGMSLGDWCESFVEIARTALASEGTPEEAQDA